MYIYLKVNPVKQFVKSNISRFEKDSKSYWGNRIFNLYDKNNSYRGDYQFTVNKSSSNKGVISSLSSIRIMNDKLKQEMAEYVQTDKNFVDIYDAQSDDLLKTKPLAKEITTITTILDFVNDKFKTIRSVSKLKNKLQRRTYADNPNVPYLDNYVVYEPLKEKPSYEKSVEYVREGSISETNSKSQIPCKFW
ncbi:hypothetical protein J6G99_02420 [bacterium]|nr:hypothetical protein [bacterium]